MIKVLINGCNGKMGCFVAQAVQSREDCNVLFGVDAFGESNYDFDVFKTFDEATETPDVIIDFSNPAPVFKEKNIATNASDMVFIHIIMYGVTNNRTILTIQSFSMLLYFAISDATVDIAIRIPKYISIAN